MDDITVLHSAYHTMILIWGESLHTRQHVILSKMKFIILFHLDIKSTRQHAVHILLLVEFDIHYSYVLLIVCTIVSVRHIKYGQLFQKWITSELFILCKTIKLFDHAVLFWIIFMLIFYMNDLIVFVARNEQGPIAASCQ